MTNIPLSIVIPVYNKEAYLKDTLNSILQQTLGLDNIEVICVNDGSTDKSLCIIESFKTNFVHLKIISQENKGVSFSRNVGIKNSSGKYILFVDGDDRISKNSAKDIVNYFDTVNDITAIISYPIFYDDGTNLIQNKRLIDIKNNKVLSIQDYPQISQTSINICIKNDQDILFNENLSICEDQLFTTQQIFKYNTIGWVPSAKYIYRKVKDGAASTTHPFFTFNQFLEFNKELKKTIYENKYRKQYIDYLWIYNLSWRIKIDYLFPYHFHRSEFRKAYSKFIASLDDIDNRTILSSNILLNEHAFYLLSLKTKNRPCISIKENRIYLIDNNIVLDELKDITMVVQRIRMISDDKIYILGFLKSGFFSFTERPVLMLNGDLFVDLYESSNSHFNSKIKTNIFWGFELEKIVKDGDCLDFQILLYNVNINVNFYFRDYNPINSSQQKFIYKSNKYTVKYTNSRIIIFKNNNFGEAETIANQVCLNYYEHKLNKKIWLYSDYVNVFSNGYFQFKHDFYIKDGVLRYYVYMGDPSLLNKYFNNEEIANVVKFGTNKHKALFILCEKILSSYSGLGQITPLNNKEFSYYSDYINFEFIYMQHGIMHADLRTLYSKDMHPFIDKIVASTKFEVSYFKNILHFRDKDILKCGQSSLSINKKRHTTQKKILYAPSWRLYLVQQNGKHEWCQRTNFLQSKFYIEAKAFLDDKKLINFLKCNKIVLDIKLHPNFAIYRQHFEPQKNSNIYLKDNINIKNYQLIITDFSSFIYNFLFNKISVVFFIPDKEEFLSGLHSYRKFVYPIEKIGKIFYKKEELVKYLSLFKFKKYNTKNLFLKFSNNVCDCIYKRLKI